MKKINKDSLDDTKPNIKQGKWPNLCYFYLAGYDVDYKSPHLVAVNEIIDDGMRIIGHNSYGDLVDPNPTLKVRRSDLKVYMILVKKVVIVGTTIDLC